MCFAAAGRGVGNEDEADAVFYSRIPDCALHLMSDIDEFFLGLGIDMNGLHGIWRIL
jgi:hypothetical protein